MRYLLRVWHSLELDKGHGLLVQNMYQAVLYKIQTLSSNKKIRVSMLKSHTK